MKDYLKEIFAGIVILAVLIAVVITSNVKSKSVRTRPTCNEKR